MKFRWSVYVRYGAYALVGLYGAHRGIESYWPEVYCRLGVGSACADASHRVLDEKGDLKLAYEWSALGCEHGEWMACNNLGVCLQRGAGVAKDEALARRAYRKACDARIGLACANLAALLRDGRGGAADSEAATRLFHQGCEFGSDAACRSAVETAATLEEKTGWAEKACALGSARDCANATLLFAQTMPKPEALKARAAKLNSACADEDSTSCVALGFLYRLGLGVPKNPERGNELFQSGCRLGHTGACLLVQAGGDVSKVKLENTREL